MSVFRVPSSNPLKSQAPVIEAVDGDHVIAAVSFSGGWNDFPVDAKKLADNVASLLNGNPPAHQLATPETAIHYQRIQSGIVLRHRSVSGENTAGTTREGLTMLVNHAAGEVAQKVFARLTPDFMSSLCATMDHRAASGVASRGPSSAPSQNRPKPTL